ncbi:MAG TPA: protein TolQ [Alphaproteobacteria bacterium]|nr:protein TolQ [Alphaproteobacteria bacterium]
MTQTLEVANQLDFFSLFFQATWFVKFIMITLAGLSVLVWAIFIEKMRNLRIVKKRADKFEEAFWGEQNLQDLYRNVRPEDTDHPLAKVFVTGLREWELAQDKDAEVTGILQVGVKERVERVMSVVMTREIDKLEKYLPFLGTIGSVAPFLGLLGTVWGIMHSFTTIGATKNTSLAVVAPGIAEALLATAIGLLAAIPAVIAYNKVSTELGRYIMRLESFVAEFTTILDRQEQEAIVQSKKTNKQRRATD